MWTHFLDIHQPSHFPNSNGDMAARLTKLYIIFFILTCLCFNKKEEQCLSCNVHQFSGVLWRVWAIHFCHFELMLQFSSHCKVWLAKQVIKSLPLWEQLHVCLKLTARIARHPKSEIGSCPPVPQIFSLLWRLLYNPGLSGSLYSRTYC